MQSVRVLEVNNADLYVSHRDGYRVIKCVVFQSVALGWLLAALCHVLDENPLTRVPWGLEQLGRS